MDFHDCRSFKIQIESHESHSGSTEYLFLSLPVPSVSRWISVPWPTLIGIIEMIRIWRNRGRKHNRQQSLVRWCCRPLHLQQLRQNSLHLLTTATLTFTAIRMGPCMMYSMCTQARPTRSLAFQRSFSRRSTH